MSARSGFRWAVWMLLLANTGGAQSLAAAKQATGPVRLQQPGPTRDRAVARMPVLLASAGVSAVIAARINGALRREDARALAAAEDCRTSFREVQGKAASDAWTRSVEVTMAGPRFVAVEVSDSYYCGGPYPNDGLRSAFVFDLTTGRPVDWLALFPRGAAARLDTAGDGAPLGLVAWPELTRRAKAQADAECRDVFDQEGHDGFVVGLDARSAELVVTPGQFPHVVQACADQVRLSTVDLRKLGFKNELVAALEQARPSRD